MSKEIKTTKTKKPSNRWDNIQKIGFWALIVLSITFWSGVIIGNYSAHQSYKEVENVKAQAIEEYKAELKQSEQ